MPHSATANIIPFGSLQCSLENRLELFAGKASLTGPNQYSFLGTVILEKKKRRHSVKLWLVPFIHGTDYSILLKNGGALILRMRWKS